MELKYYQQVRNRNTTNCVYDLFHVTIKLLIEASLFFALICGTRERYLLTRRNFNIEFILFVSYVVRESENVSFHLNILQ